MAVATMGNQVEGLVEETRAVRRPTVMVLDRRAEYAFRELQQHMSKCQPCEDAGAETTADKHLLCPTGRRLLETWDAAEEEYSAAWR